MMGFYISLSDERHDKDHRKGFPSILLELLVDPSPLSSQHPLRAPLPFNKGHFNTGLTTES